MRRKERILYRALGDVSKYVLERDYSNRNKAAFRVFDVAGGDALVFLTPRQVQRLIGDLTPYAGVQTNTKPRTRR